MQSSFYHQKGQKITKTGDNLGEKVESELRGLTRLQKIHAQTILKEFSFPEEHVKEC